MIATHKVARGRRVFGGRTAGLTLAEMMIVLSVVGVLAAISVPYFLRETPAARASAAAEALAHSMRLARFRAITLNRAVYFRLEPSGVADFYTAYAHVGPIDSVPQGTAEEIAATRIDFSDRGGAWRGSSLPHGVSFDVGSAGNSPDGGTITSAIDLPTNPIVFEPRGTVTWPSGEAGQSGTVYLAHEKTPGAVRAVTINRTGLIEVWYMRGGSWQ